MTDDINPFDEMQEEARAFDTQNQEQLQKIDYLIHAVFKQSEQGAELLDIFLESLIMQPTVVPGMDQFTAGINEGEKQFIRKIIQTITTVEAIQ